MPTFELADDHVRRPASCRRRLSSTTNMHSLARLVHISRYEKDTLAHDYAMSAELKTPAFEPERPDIYFPRSAAIRWGEFRQINI